MIYFIPSWYKDADWKEREAAWYFQYRKSELDDTVKQIQLFSRNHLYDYQIVLLAHAPNFRRFLHRQSIFRANYWSVFDSIQCITTRRIGLFSYTDLSWPKGIEFVYTPFVIYAYLHEKLYAKLEFGDDGNLIYLDMFDQDIKIRTNIYDDRGFVSLTILYEDGVPSYEKYLDSNGIWKIQKDMHTGRVEVNPSNAFYLGVYGQKKYSKLHYQCIEDIILEVFEDYLNHTDSDDIFSLAMDNTHYQICESALGKRKLLLSFYADRCNLEDAQIDSIISKARYIVTDRRSNMNKIRRKGLKNRNNICDITPYDFRIDESIGQEFSERNILVAIDGLPQYYLEELVRELGNYMASNPKVKIHLFTRRLSNEVQVQVNQILQTNLGEDSPLLNRFVIAQYDDALSINRKIRESIMLIDLADKPDMFLGMTSLSLGIPQLLTQETRFVRPDRNGQIIKNLNEIGTWLDYYLTDLSHLNEAKIESYKLGNTYSAERLKEMWVKVIENINGTD
jgi:accessory secretory protein Asp1